MAINHCHSDDRNRNPARAVFTKKSRVVDPGWAQNDVPVFGLKVL